MSLCKISQYRMIERLLCMYKVLLRTGREKDPFGVISAMHLHASQREGHALSGSGGRVAGEGRGAARHARDRFLSYDWFCGLHYFCFAPVTN